MDKEKEIEEFAEAIDRRLDEANLVCGSMNKGKGHWIAEGLFQTYRKVDEVRRETVKELAERLSNVPCFATEIAASFAMRLNVEFEKIFAECGIEVDE